MKNASWSVAVVGIAFFAVTQIAVAATVPFVEDFSADVADWKDASSGPLDFLPAGGPDGSSHAGTAFSFSGNGPNDNQTIFRGQDAFDSSGDAFVGDWIADGVATLSAQVRHNAPLPLAYFARLAPSVNFPGGIALQFAPVLPGTWTEISFQISPSSPQLFYFEGGDFNSVYSNIGNIQLGVTVPASLAGGTPAYSFDLDQVAISPIPEPSTIGLGIVCLAGLTWRRSRL